MSVGGARRPLTPFLFLGDRVQPLRLKTISVSGLRTISAWLNVDTAELPPLAKRRARLSVRLGDLRPEHARARHHGRSTAVRG